MIPVFRLSVAAAALLLAAGSARAGATFTVEPIAAADQKAVFATVESLNTVPARVRTGGTVVSLSVREGDRVEQGQVIAVVGDRKLALEREALDAQLAALSAQATQAQSELERNAPLPAAGMISENRLDELRTAVAIAADGVKARQADLRLIDQRLAEGQVLAPVSGRVLAVPVTVGSVVASGETAATVARQDLTVRLRVPERHARFLKTGAPVRLDGEDLGPDSGTVTGIITLVYPQIRDGRVIADARVSALGDYFVGQRVRVWIATGARPAIVVPPATLTTRFGLDYARLQRPDGSVVEVPVQRGRPLPQPNLPDGVEILSGLQAGDILVQP